ncbi:helix-turn-helix transcriptional regulator [Mesobacillus foraminis]|uniref:helix-turn-helix transcriptional regulator n=1 Tax=Mesobacillus foraminis TaxID=279826 RepID=UPI000EF54546|nr:helix-turn-helix transcriptional regulator [Mesobacillus foraminis]
MHYGPLIKYHRIQKGLTQKELANGICSIPHLSKIESNSKEGNLETIRLLLERLDINLEDIDGQEVKIGELIAKLNDRINYHLKEEADSHMEELDQLEGTIPYSSMLYSVELTKLRYLIFSGSFKEAEAHKDRLNKQKKNFSQHEFRLFCYLNALFLLKRGAYKQANSILHSLSEDMLPGIAHGEFYYHQALSKTSLEQSGYAIHYGKMALQAYTQDLNFIRILHTLMLLGINYTHAKIYEEALNCFNHLIRNAALMKDIQIRAQIYHNMGYLQKKIGEKEKALSYFNHSLSLAEKDTHPYMISLYSVGEIYYWNGQYLQASNCFKKVKVLAKKLQIKKYQILSTYYLLSIERPSESWDYLESKVIPAVEESQAHYEDLHSFYKLLSSHYISIGQVEKAVEYLGKIS